MPKAYWISTYEKVLDDNKLAAYAALAGPALKRRWWKVPGPGHSRENL